MLLSGLLVGIAFGFLIQKGQFCFTSGFRDIYYQKDFSFLFALFITISIQSIGFFTLNHLGFLQIPTTQLPLLATIVGGLIFGIGMAISRVCVTGAWFRSTEGAISASIALITFAITLTSIQSGSMKSFFAPLTQASFSIDNIYTTLGISPWWLVLGILLMTFILGFYSKNNPNKKQLYIVAILLGFLGIIAWILSSWSGRNYGFGISVPTTHLFQYITTGQQRYLNWGSVFVLGIPIGSFIAAKVYNTFEWKILNSLEFLRSIFGGILMGIGAFLANGCTATNALVATAYFSWQGWIAMIFMIIGCIIGSSFFKNKHCELRRKT